MLTMPDYEEICARQIERLAYGAHSRDEICDSATVALIVSQRLRRTISTMLSEIGPVPDLTLAHAATTQAGSIAAALPVTADDATDLELIESVMRANQHLTNAFTALHRLTPTSRAG